MGLIGYPPILEGSQLLCENGYTVSVPAFAGPWDTDPRPFFKDNPRRIRDVRFGSISKTKQDMKT